MAPTDEDGALYERVLPTGLMHLVVRWSERPLVVYYDGLTKSLGASASLVGGTRSKSYLRQLSNPSYSVGAQLYPGAAACLFGAPASELAEQHTELDSVWSAAEGSELRERLQEARDAEAKLRILEGFLLPRCTSALSLHPAIVEALRRLPHKVTIAELVAHSGYSHRAFIRIFRSAVGLTPKVYARVARLNRALELMNQTTCPRMVEVALHAGYADQAHFTREFARIAGVNPTYYLKSSSPRSNHVPIRQNPELANRNLV